MVRRKSSTQRPACSGGTAKPAESGMAKPSRGSIALSCRPLISQNSRYRDAIATPVRQSSLSKSNTEAASASRLSCGLMGIIERHFKSEGRTEQGRECSFVSGADQSSQELLQNPKPLIQYLKPQTSGEVAEWLKAAVC